MHDTLRTIMLYHKDVFLPRKIRNAVPSKVVKPTYTQHAIRAANTDRYGKLPLPDAIDLSKATLIEVEKYNAGIVKIVVRVNISEKIDLCLAIIPANVIDGGNCWMVKTVWANETGDCHNTLDSSRYVKMWDVA